MKTDELIADLVKDTGTLKRLAPPEQRLRLWFVVSFLIVGISVLSFGVRPDLGQAILNPNFILEGTSALLLGVLAGWSAFVLSVPGRERSSLVRYLPLGLLFVWMGLLTYRNILTPSSFHPGFVQGQMCTRNFILLSLIPGGLLLFMIKKAAPLRLAWAGALSLLAVGSLGSLGISFLCPSGDALHILVWHFVPVLLFGIAGIWVGKKIFSWVGPY